jgi:iron(II)-dependent oxidoreductase
MGCRPQNGQLHKTSPSDLENHMLTAEKAVAVPNELLGRIVDARLRSDALFDIVRRDSLYERPIPERHRIIFYLGHLEAFDWNLLQDCLSRPASASVHSDLDRLFAFGIDPVGGGLPSDVPSDWPSLDVVRGYVRGVRSALDKSLATTDFAAVARDGYTLQTLLNVAIEHRLMHVETLAYMFHRLPFDQKVHERQRTELQPVPCSPLASHMVSIPAGGVTLGLRPNGNEFGWDNEYEAHAEQVPAFEIDRYKVTNRLYLKFIEEGGYETRSFWSENDWNWKGSHGISHPAFWEKRNDTWHWRGMFDLIPLDAVSSALDWPVYVSHAEANAYARWAGKALPTEAEWQRAAYGSAGESDSGEARAYPWGNEAPSGAKQPFGNFDFRRWDPTPVNAFPDGQSAFGVDDMLGNGWEWTSTVFAPLPGFQPFSFYRGYSADFFDGKHFVMKGGSPRTAACMLRPTFRNWFQAHYQYVYAGFRCVSR